MVCSSLDGKTENALILCTKKQACLIEFPRVWESWLFPPSSFCMLLAGAEEEKTAELLHLREDLIEGRA